MKTKMLEAPALYADHHVTEVRRILSELDGVTEVYASSAFQVVEVTYDEKKINDLEIALKLDEAGYLGEWTVPIEVGAAVQEADGEKPFFRHTTTYETLKQTVSFAQQVTSQGRPLWHCPGMSRVKVDEVENG
jgi:copper chaperone CopZ